MAISLKDFKCCLKAYLTAYLIGQGLMGRGQFALMNLAVIALSIAVHMGLIYLTERSGVAVTNPEQLQTPVWAVLFILSINAALVPAIIMRTRDAGWPVWFFSGLFGVHLLFSALHSFLSVMLPAGAAFVLQGLAILGIFTLMVKPSVLHE